MKVIGNFNADLKKQALVAILGFRYSSNFSYLIAHFPFSLQFLSFFLGSRRGGA